MNKAFFFPHSLDFTPITDPDFSELKIANIKVNDKLVLTDVSTIIDTDAHFIYGDPLRVLTLH